MKLHRLRAKSNKMSSMISRNGLTKITLYTVTFKKMLISGKAQDFGKDSSKLSESVIDYFAKMFSTAVSENKDEPNKLKASFQAIMPHPFGDHKVCDDLQIEWCQFLKDPENFRHKYLEKGEDLLGDGLRSCIEAKFQTSPQMTLLEN